MEGVDLPKQSPLVSSTMSDQEVRMFVSNDELFDFSMTRASAQLGDDALSKILMFERAKRFRSGPDAV